MKPEGRVLSDEDGFDDVEENVENLESVEEANQRKNLKKLIQNFWTMKKKL